MSETESEQKQMECQYCDGHIQIITTKPSVKTNYRWIATNMDGTPHKHNRFNKQQQQQPQQPQQTQPQQTIDEELDKYTYEARQQAIQQAHKQNMDASKQLRQSIDNLTLSINTLTAASANIAQTVTKFSLAIQEYLQIASSNRT